MTISATRTAPAGNASYFGVAVYRKPQLRIVHPPMGGSGSSSHFLPSTRRRERAQFWRAALAGLAIFWVGAGALTVTQLL